jgi:OFA family oxalate/formate antiporter-like MFS transporter
MSLAVGILYMTPISICVKYYPDKKGLVCGIILGFYGLSGVII